jgi:hypothetical protein
MLIISNIAANTARAFIRIPPTSCATSFVVFISKPGASVNHDFGDTEQLVKHAGLSQAVWSK